jgi:hypothetical protein
MNILIEYRLFLIDNLITLLHDDSTKFKVFAGINFRNSIFKDLLTKHKIKAMTKKQQRSLEGCLVGSGGGGCFLSSSGNGRRRWPI